MADIARVAVAFTSHPDDARFPSEFYSVVNDRLNVLKSAGYIITTIVMDLLIVGQDLTNLCRPLSLELHF